MAYGATPRIDMGRVLARAFDFLGRHLGPILLGALLVSGVPALASNLVQDPDAGWSEGAVLIGAFVLFAWIGASLLQAAVTHAAIQDMGDRAPDWGGSFRLTLVSLLPLIAINVVVAIAVGVGTLLLVIPGLIALAAFSVAVPALVEERGGVWRSMGRSRDLTRGARFKIILLYIVFYVLTSLLGLLLLFIVSQVPAVPFLPAIAEVTTGMVSGVLTAVVGASLYIELRTVKEGANFEHLGQVFA